ncbi:Uma2 family endonuclease [Iningainema tapete]|uniref:Uma2 family endonuclease n=1 Tax=Iningainema tapete BLCC-T55 TaxID=2748662 RepID=A0A8J6XFT6_9CYAN|nr:Uma2 family endonuclease [Iningainema tapete]MBD2774999.1 Uma2 family endonuclease [Iningainema tapete BLCC-T55]
MVNLPPITETIPINTWVEATWEDFLTFADEPTLKGAKLYYDDGYMRIEISPLSSVYAQDNTIVSNVIVLYAAIKNIPIKRLTNTFFKKVEVHELQPDIAFYIGKKPLPPQNNSSVNLNESNPPTLIVEIASSSLEDDTERKQKLYQRLGVQEYWVVDVNACKVIANLLSATQNTLIRESQVLPGLEIALVEEALKRSLTDDDGAITRWLLAKFNQ